MGLFLHLRQSVVAVIYAHIVNVLSSKLMLLEKFCRNDVNFEIIMTHLPLLGKELFEEMFILYVCELQVLREKIDTHYSKGTPMSFDAVPLHDVAAVLKLFLRELPDPLLTSERVNAFIKIDSKCTFSLLTTYRIFSSTFTVICSYLAFLFNAIESTHTHTHTPV